MSYDSRCSDLAEVFLADESDVTPADIADLAQTIQTAIEDWLGSRDLSSAEKSP